MSCEQQTTARQSQHQIAIHPRESIQENRPRRQQLMRCGLKFYCVYADDGSLVEDADPHKTVPESFRATPAK